LAGEEISITALPLDPSITALPLDPHVVARFSGTAGECVDFSIGFAHSLGVFFKDLFDSLESPICCLRALICCLSVFLALLLDSLECSAS
jgi:hypothetical protein